MSIIKRSNETLFDVFQQFVPDFFGARSLQPLNEMFTDRLPGANVKETDSSYELEVALPGISKENVNIAIEGNMLVIHGEGKSENDERQNALGKFTKREFCYSNFKRSFFIPPSVDQDHITAQMENGLLHVTMPKFSRDNHGTRKQINIG